MLNSTLKLIHNQIKAQIVYSILEILNIKKFVTDPFIVFTEVFLWGAAYPSI